MTERTNVLGLPVPEPEPYLSRKAMAEHMGISVDTLDNLVKQGMPSHTWGLRRRVFRLSEAIPWAEQYAARVEAEKQTRP